MSSNIRLQKVCKECGKEFVAKTTVTKFCSHQCNSRHYKRNKRDNFLDKALMIKHNRRAVAAITPAASTARTHKPVFTSDANALAVDSLTRELLDIRELAIVVGLSERSIYRLLKDPVFPTMRIGKRILFKKEHVLNYLTTKYTTNERQTSGEAQDQRQDSIVY